MKEELLQIFPKPVLITPYEKPISKELEFIRTLEWLAQKLMETLNLKIAMF